MNECRDKKKVLMMIRGLCHHRVRAVQNLYVLKGPKLEIE